MDYITFRNCTMQESEYKLPHALVGCEKEEDFKLLITANNQQIHFFEEETGKHFEGNFFKTIKDLEFNSLNQFNVNLYRSFARFYEKEIGKYPSDEITLWSFNNAYRIAMDGLREPLRFNINKYEKALSEVKIHGIRIPRDRQEVVAVICMAYAILEEEEEKSAKLNYVLSLTKASYHSFIKKMKNTQDATPPLSTTETATETEEEVKTTPPNHSYTEEEQKSIAKVLRQEINEYIIERLKECIKLCESQVDYALLEIALYENNYIKKRNGHQAFIKAMIALHLLEDGSVKTENLRQKFTSLRKSYATSGMYNTWDTNNTDRIKCEKFAEILKA